MRRLALLLLALSALSPASFGAQEEARLAALPVSVIDPPPAQPSNQLEQVRELAAKALVEEKLGNYGAALRFTTMALSASPGHPFLSASLDRLTRAIRAREPRSAALQEVAGAGILADGDDILPPHHAPGDAALVCEPCRECAHLLPRPHSAGCAGGRRGHHSA